jgi:predicted TIM-barrel fold metal-dependent hydrolase
MRKFGKDNDGLWYGYAQAKSLRPIVTIASGSTPATGDGTEANPWVLD